MGGPDMDSLEKTAYALEHQIGFRGLEATIPAPAPLSGAVQENLHAIAALPLVGVGKNDGDDLKVVGELGAGGMGIVELAEQGALDRQVAVKRVRDDAEGRLARALILEEARITGSLEHPNIVPVYALGRNADGEPVMVMKRLEGTPWADLLDDPDHPGWPDGVEEDRLVWHLETLIQLCNALHFAHSHGVVHRDVKPDNVIVGQFGEVYLLDWGCAHHMSAEPSATIVGTLAYMAPEMLRGSGPHLTARTDVYLLGACLYEVLTGRPPHRCDDLVTALMHIKAAGSHTFPQGAPAELMDIAERALRPHPSKRFASALELQEAIKDYIRHRGSYAVAQAAEARWRELQERGAKLLEDKAADDPALDRLFIECRFGFVQALDAWPENYEAKGGLVSAIRLMIEIELKRRNAEAATALLAELKQPPQELVRRVDRLRDELKAQAKELAALREGAHERDPRVASRARAISSIITGAVLGGSFMALAYFFPGARGLTHGIVLSVAGAVTLGMAITVYAKRAEMLATAINRFLWAAIFAIVVACGAVHVAGVLGSMPIGFALAADMVISAAVVATVGLNLNRGLIAVALVYLVGGVVAAAWPARVLEALAGTFLLSHAVVAWTWLALEQEDAGAVAAPQSRR